MYSATRKMINYPWSGMDPEAPEPKTMEICSFCGEDLREDYTYFRDEDGNFFCCQDCAVNFHDIKEMEW